MTRRSKRRQPSGGGVLVHDPATPGIARLLTDLRPQDQPTVVYGQLAESLGDSPRLLVFGFGILRELQAELGTYDAVWAWVGSLATRLDRPVLCNVPDGPDGSVTITIAPPAWTPERLRGYVAGHHQELQRAYGPISHLGQP